MPKLIKATPKYTLHRPSGQAVVYIDDRMIYLGPHKSKASLVEYDRVITEWLANGRRLPPETAAHEITIVELIAEYIRYAKCEYSQQNTGYFEWRKIAEAVRPLKRLCGKTAVAKFTARKLKAVRQPMIDADVSRKHINTQIGRIKRMFKWGTSEDMVPPGIHQTLLRPDWEYFFSPQDSEARRRELATQARQTPLSCGNRVGTNRKSKPQRLAGECYTNDSYRRAIHRACDNRTIPSFPESILRSGLIGEISAGQVKTGC